MTPMGMSSVSSSAALPIRAPQTFLEERHRRDRRLEKKRRRLSKVAKGLTPGVDSEARRRLGKKVSGIFKKKEDENARAIELPLKPMVELEVNEQ